MPGHNDAAASDSSRTGSMVDERGIHGGVADTGLLHADLIIVGEEECSRLFASL